jgi:hypothetical protein
MPDVRHKTSRSISAENQFTDGLVVPGHGRHHFMAHAYNSSSFVGTITVQGKKLDQADALYVDFETTLDGNKVKVGEIIGDWVLRIGVKTGNYTSGTIDVALYYSD